MWGIDQGQSGTSRTQQEMQVGHQVADAIADKLVIEIRDLGLPAERGSAVPAGTQHAVLIKGQLVSIDEGNRRPSAWSSGSAPGAATSAPMPRSTR